MSDSEQFDTGLLLLDKDLFEIDYMDGLLYVFIYQ